MSTIKLEGMFVLFKEILGEVNVIFPKINYEISFNWSYGIKILTLTVWNKNIILKSFFEGNIKIFA